MKDKFEELLENKTSYLKRVRALFRKTKSPYEKREAYIPRSFRNIDPSDVRWTTRPQNMVSLFQKMIMHIQDPQRRVAVLNNLVILTDSPNSPYIDGHRMHLQDQIFRGITGCHFGEPLRFAEATHSDIQERDFFRLIGMGIDAYETLPSEKKHKFNKAVMPKVKKTSVELPYRLQQYVR